MTVAQALHPLGAPPLKLPGTPFPGRGRPKVAHAYISIEIAMQVSMQADKRISQESWSAVGSHSLSPATKATMMAAKFDPAMASHLEPVQLDPPNLTQADGSPEAFACFVCLQNR
jgi:hypothetical protein